MATSPLVAHSIFTHAARHQVERCLSKAAAVLEPEGAFVATFNPAPKSYEGTEWVYPGCITYTPSDLRAMAVDAGLDCHWLRWEHPTQQWAIFTHPDLTDRLLRQYPFMIYRSYKALRLARLSSIFLDRFLNGGRA